MQSKSLNIKVPRLGVNRFGVYYVRSSALDHATGRRKVSQQSLGTKSPTLAKVLALKFCLNLVHEDLMSDWRKFTSNYELNTAQGIAIAKDAEDHARLLEAMAELKALEAQKTQSVMEMVKTMGPEYAIQMMMQRNAPPSVAPQTTTKGIAQDPATEHLVVAALASSSKPTNAGVKLQDAIKEHLNEEKQHIKPDTVREKESIFDEFAAFFGKDIYLNQITKSDITERWRKAEFARPNQKRPGEKLGANRREKRRGYLSKLFQWAIDGGQYMHPNPMDQKMAKKKEIKATTTSYKDFTSEDLRSLFGPKFVADMDKPDWYWIPLMSLFSGARLGEVCSLSVDDFEEIDGIKCYFIPDAKTPGGRRTVPIHSALLGLGLWTYRDFLKSRNEAKLLWFRPKSKPTKSVGEQWGKWVSRCGIADKSKVFHSFRSTAITDMYDSDAPNPAAIRDTVGHTGGTAGVHGKYIHGGALKRALAAIESLQFPTVDITVLRREDPTFSAFYEVEKARLTSDEYAKQMELRKSRVESRAKRAAYLVKRAKPALPHGDGQK